MDANERRDNILKHLGSAPISATALAQKFGVSRQVIVGDMAILRASGMNIVSTPRGYIFEENAQKSSNLYVIACKHKEDLLKDELFAIVDHGASVIDVIVEHAVYGQIQCPLRLSSRYDCEKFIEKIRETTSSPLCDLTNGVHFHTISCPNDECFARVKIILKKLNILIDD